MRSTKLAKTAITQFLSIYATVLTQTWAWPMMFGTINGIAKAVENVKEVMPFSSTPGYLLITSTISFLPVFMCMMCIFSQMIGSVPLSQFMMFLSLSCGLAVYKGYVATLSSNSKDFKKMYKRAHERTAKAKTISNYIFLAWLLYNGKRMIIDGAPELDEVREQLNALEFKPVIHLFIIIVCFFTEFFFCEAVTMICLTDLVMVAIFDAVDDELQADEKGDSKCGKEQLLKEWHMIYPPQPKKKKKEKKEKEKKEKKDKSGGGGWGLGAFGFGEDSS